MCGPSGDRPCRRPWIAIALVLAIARMAAAAPPDAGVPAADGAAAPAPAPPPGPADPRAVAAEIHALIAGTLDPAVDASTLFVVDLAEPTAAAQLATTLAPPQRAPAAKPAADDDPERVLAAARAEFFALPRTRRLELLHRHALAHADFEASSGALVAKQRRLAELQHDARELQAFLDGTAAPDSDPRRLLRVDLGSDSEIALAGDRRTQFLALLEGNAPPAGSGAGSAAGSGAGSAAGSASDAGASIDAQLAAARHELDAQRARFVNLSAGARAALFADLERRRAALARAPGPDAGVDQPVAAGSDEQAALEARSRAAADKKAHALAAAGSAATESARELEVSRARLQDLVERQAHAEEHLLQEQRSLDPVRELALTWDRRVNELIDAGDSGAADKAYDELVTALTEQRDALRRAIDDLDATSDIPRTDRSGVNPALTALSASVNATAIRLTALEERVRWERASTYRDAIVAMNHARQRLLPALGAEQFATLQGFGPQGRAQAARELDQITLEVRYHLRALPRVFGDVVDSLGARPLETAKSLLLLLALIAGFRSWRRRATRILARAQVRPAAHVTPRPFQRLAVTALWYLARIRGPLEWLLALWVLGQILPTVMALPELQLVAFVLRWALMGTLAIRLLDAIVARQAVMEAGADSTEALRYRSFRIIAVTVVSVGVILSLARVAVGEGAIYAWVWRTCWLLAVPIFLQLLAWWRKPIFARLRARGEELRGIPRWVIAHERGVASFFATILGAAWLLVTGIGRWLFARASALKTTRRLLAYLFRREVERHAAARRDDASFAALAPATYDALDPDDPGTPTVESVMASAVAEVEALARTNENRVIAIIGERGLGKTTFLRRVAGALPAETTCWIACEPGYAGFLRAVARGLGTADASEDELCATLQARRPALVVVDDGHLLVRPMIGGLDDLDRAMAFALRVAGSTTWAFAISKNSWHFLRLARSDRAMFDRVIELDRWNEHQLTELTRARAAAAHLTPRFDELVVPRQIDASPYRTEERAERDYHRILWDYADGNPRVALHWWRESLFQRDGELFVRLFKTHPIDATEPVASGLRFVLRAIVQLDLAIESDLVACTNLDAADVRDALRTGIARGLIEMTDGRYRIPVHAFRAVILFLRRQHLLLT